MSKQTKLTRAARGRDCMVRLPGCPNNTETTVLAHYRLAGTCGMGIKPKNAIGAWACFFCHEAIDARTATQFSHEYLRLAHAEGVMRTLDILIREDLVRGD